MVLLARRQERELRQWLYGAKATSPARTLSEQAEELAAEIELDHDLPVELVVVGDHQVDDTVTALLGAVREAAVNAAKHAGADEVAVYVEVNPERLVAYVRDKGQGFVPDGIPADRHGIDDSIRGRRGPGGRPGPPRDRTGRRHRVGAGGPGMTCTDLGAPRVFVVDDHGLFRAGVRAELGGAVRIVGDAGDVEGAITGIVDTRPDVVLLDVHLPGGGGRAVIEAVARRRRPMSASSRSRCPTRPRTSSA